MSAAAALVELLRSGGPGAFLATGSTQRTHCAPSSAATTMSLVHSPVQARANTLLTDLAYHAPPRGVVIPRAFSASAI
jgi:hypothetical protein